MIETIVDAARLLAESYRKLEHAPDELVDELEILFVAVNELESHLEHLKRAGWYAHYEMVEVKA